jgi:hypothetical protein
VRIDKAAAIERLRSEVARLEGQIDAGLAQMAALRATLADPRCTGEAYDAFRARMTSLRIPAAQAHCAAFEAIREADVQNIQALEALPETSPGILDTAECDRLMADLISQNEQLGALGSRMPLSGDGTFAIGQYQALISLNRGMIGTLEAKRAAASSYASRSQAIYAAACEAASGLLRGPAASIASYLANGSLGDTSWTAGAAAAFAESSGKVYDRRMMRLSEEREGAMLLSSDCGHIFYKGRKWEIEGWPGVAVPTFSGPAFTAVYTEYETRVFTYDEFNLWRFMAGFGSGFSDAAPKKAGQGVEYHSEEVATEMTATMAVFGIISNAADSMEEYTFAFRFMQDGIGGQRVAILEKDERYIKPVSLQASGGPLGSLAARNAYEAVTGREVPLLAHPLYDVVFRLDEARAEEGAYQKRYYFDGSGILRSSMVWFPGDKVELLVGPMGMVETIDITEWMKEQVRPGGVHEDTERRIMEHIEVQGGQGGK